MALRLKLFYVVILISLGLSGLAVGEEEYQQQQQDYPDDISDYPLIQFDAQSGNPTVSYLQWDESNRLQPKFVSQSIAAGKELAIRSYWVSKGLIEAYRAKRGVSGFARGPGSPKYDEIIKGFRSSDSASFNDIVARLDELRRKPDNLAEAEMARDVIDKNRKTRPEEYLSRPVIGTGMIEVEDPGISMKGNGNRLFIPLSSVLGGQVRIDPQRARIKILKSMVGIILSESVLVQKGKIEANLNQTFAAIECRSSPCATQGAVFSQIVDVLAKASVTDNPSRFDIMDTNYDEKVEKAERKLLNGILRELKSLCLP